MDRYLSVKKPIKVDKKNMPYSTLTKLDEDRQRWSTFLAPLSADGRRPSSSTMTKYLVNTLSDKSNPITHSNIHERSDAVISAATGHQRGEKRAPHGAFAKFCFKERSEKLSVQRSDEPSQGVLSNVRVYIDGYLSGTTDIELKRTITQGGGSTLLVPNGATHIVTSRQLDRAKTHRILAKKSSSPVHVVKPEWVTDSISAGRRLQESHYALIKIPSTRNLVDMLRSGGSD